MNKNILFALFLFLYSSLVMAHTVNDFEILAQVISDYKELYNPNISIHDRESTIDSLTKALTKKPMNTKEFTESFLRRVGDISINDMVQCYEVEPENEGEYFDFVLKNILQLGLQLDNKVNNQKLMPKIVALAVVSMSAAIMAGPKPGNKFITSKLATSALALLNVGTLSFALHSFSNDGQGVDDIIKNIKEQASRIKMAKDNLKKLE